MKIEGMVTDIIFQNPDNGYTVCTVQYEDDEISCVGEMIDIHPGEYVSILGSWTSHPVYGDQIKVSIATKSMPTTQQGMEKYLSSGVIKGVGPKTAKNIVKKFGDDTFRIIEEEPQELATINGISAKKAGEIHEAFTLQYALRQAMLMLQEYGVSPNFAKKIYEKYGNKTKEVIKENPYRLANDIAGIGFKKADEIAMQMGVEQNDPHRFESGILYILNNFAANGHTYMPKQQLVEDTIRLLIPDEYTSYTQMVMHMENPEEAPLLENIMVDNAITELAISKRIIVKNYDGEPCVFLTFYYKYEQEVAQKLLDLSRAVDEEADDIEDEIKATEKDLSITLVEEQKEAVRQVLRQGVTVITGGPGTGKTTTIRAILDMLEKNGDDVLLAAPTGRAAKRMSEATGKEAQTIHRLLELGYHGDDSRRQEFAKNEDNPLEADVIIIDEMSMVDISLMYALLKAVIEGQRLILIGDSDQLPSVGAGNVLKDIIRSERIPVIRLNTIFRQAQESDIVMNAHKINQGQYPVCNKKGTDFFFEKKSDQNDVKKTIVDLILRRIPNFKKVDSLKDIQVLSPMRKGVLGVNELNKALQESLNPKSPMKPEKEQGSQLFRVGDKVMQIKNNYNMPWKIKTKAGLVIDEGTGVFNGDCGMIDDITAAGVDVIFDDGKIVTYEPGHLDELELAYAVTIHKSQGSEYPVVILPLYNGAQMLLTRNLLYTAVTRAKQMVIGVGLLDTMNRMVDNNSEVKRYSSLARQLQNLP